MGRLNGHDYVVEREHRRLLEAEADREAAHQRAAKQAGEESTGVWCSSCLHDRGCEHTRHMVDAIERGDHR